MDEAPKSARERKPRREIQEWSTRRKTQVVLGGLTVIVLVLGLAYAVPALLKKQAGPVVAGPVQAEVVQEPAGTPGSDPFTQSVAAADNPSVAGVAPAEGTGAAPSTAGDTEALYAGTRNNPGSDPARLASSLQGDPAEAAGWAGVQGIAPSAVGSFISGLTPVLLRADVRVTDYGWRNGQPVARQSVLQAGTAVLVDALGQPRVRSVSGSPLGSPLHVSAAPRYTGASWAGFTPKNIEVVAPAPIPVDHFVIYDLGTGQTFVRPVGTLGSADYPVEAPPAPPLAVAPAPAPAPAPVGPPAPVAVESVPSIEELDSSGDWDYQGPWSDGDHHSSPPDHDDGGHDGGHGDGGHGDGGHEGGHEGGHGGGHGGGHEGGHEGGHGGSRH
jgi:hypothetical protein